MVSTSAAVCSSPVVPSAMSPAATRVCGAAAGSVSTISWGLRPPSRLDSVTPRSAVRTKLNVPFPLTARAEVHVDPVPRGHPASRAYDPNRAGRVPRSVSLRSVQRLPSREPGSRVREDVREWTRSVTRANGSVRPRTWKRKYVRIPSRGPIAQYPCAPEVRTRRSRRDDTCPPLRRTSPAAPQPCRARTEPGRLRPGRRAKREWRTGASVRPQRLRLAPARPG